MCGRYGFSRQDSELERIVQIARQNTDDTRSAQAVISEEIAPTSIVPVLLARHGRITAEFQRWGIRNRYGRTMINARAETVTEKPMFRRSIAAQRCVIPASGYYEWDKARHCYYFTRPDQPLYLGGIYDIVDGQSCFVILTTAPNASVCEIHDRMPLILSRQDIRPWLLDAGAALHLLTCVPPPLTTQRTDGQLSFDPPGPAA